MPRRTTQHITQQNEVIKSLQERVRHYEELSVEREVQEAIKEKEVSPKILSNT